MKNKPPSPTSVVISPAMQADEEWWSQPLQQVTLTWQEIQTRLEDTKAKFVLNRAFVMNFGLVGASCLILCTFGGLLVTSPLWIPVMLISSPIWIPVGFLSSPLWIPAILFLVFSFMTFISIFVFFALPTEWLPRNHPIVRKFLRVRQSVETRLIKWQAKLLLYMAGVGPAADALFLALERIDLQEAQQRLSEVDWQKMDIGELQKLCVEAIQALLKAK